PGDTALSQILGAFSRRVGENHRKFVTAMANCGIDGTPFCLQPLADSAQRAVTYCVAVRVVDLLQSIQIQNKERGTTSRALMPFRLVFERFLQPAIVAEA